MKIVPTLAIGMCLVGTLGYAKSTSNISNDQRWTGNLMDASCVDTKGTVSGHHRSGAVLSKECAPTAATTDFAFRSSSSGRIYKLDNDGNAKAEKAVADRVVRPSKNGEFHAVVLGLRKGDQITVQEVSARKYRGTAVY